MPTMPSSNKSSSGSGFGRSRLSHDQTGRLLEHFVAGTPARTAAALIGVHRNSATLFFHRLRETIAENVAISSPRVPEPAGEFEVGIHVFGAAGVLQTARGGPRVPTAIGLLRRGGHVWTVVLPDAGGKSIQALLSNCVPAGAVVYADRPELREGLEALGVRCQVIAHGARRRGGRAHISGIENFWSQAERSLRRYNGVPSHHFVLFIKECEWRFNCRSPDQQLAQLAQWIESADSRGPSVPAPVAESGAVE
jgi:transposase